MNSNGNAPHPLASRMQGIEPFHVMDVLARARQLENQGVDVVHMEIGEPDFDTPSPIIEAGIRALQDGHTHYTPALGLWELRQAIAAFYRQRFAVTVDPQCIVITPGASGALLLALGVIADRDQKILMADPGYPCNRHFVRFLEGKASSIPVSANERYQLTADLVARYWDSDTVAALIATPANPTGGVVSGPQMAAMAQVARERGGVLLVDEIYQGLVYDQQSVSALAWANDVFVINSFSKYFCMTGWRLGWLVVPEAYLDPINKLAQNIFLAASTPAQYAALAAFAPETISLLEQRRREFQERRDFLLPALRALGFKVPVIPDGAFYLYADAADLTDDSYRFAVELLNTAGVAITPGIDFGTHKAKTHVRFAYTTSLARLHEGVERIARFLS